MNTPCEKEYDFTLALAGIQELTEQAENALFEAGCDDATISVRARRITLTFTRKANSLKDAVFSAIRNVREAKIGAYVLHVDDCDLVTQAEIARKIDRTRQQVNQYVTGKRGPGDFPSPACELHDGAYLWYWCEVAHWLCENNLIKEQVVREATELAIINKILGLEHLKKIDPGFTEEVFNELFPNLHNSMH